MKLLFAEVNNKKCFRYGGEFVFVANNNIRKLDRHGVYVYIT